MFREAVPGEFWATLACTNLSELNLKGPYFLIQALLPVFAKPASIVLNGSVNAHIGMPNTTIYAATKAGLLSLARTVSGELVARGIRVNAVSPGPISTPLYDKLGFSESELKAVASSIQGQVPAGRFGTPSEVASAVGLFAQLERPADWVRKVLKVPAGELVTGITVGSALRKV